MARSWSPLKPQPAKQSTQTPPKVCSYAPWGKRRLAFSRRFQPADSSERETCENQGTTGHFKIEHSVFRGLAERMAAGRKTAHDIAEHPRREPGAQADSECPKSVA